MKVSRAARVAEELRAELADLLTTELTDPRLREVIVSHVRLSDDLRHARVYFRFLSGPGDQAKVDAAEAALRGAHGKIRREVTSRLALRFAPELLFFYDEAADDARRMDALFEEIKPK